MDFQALGGYNEFRNCQGCFILPGQYSWSLTSDIQILAAPGLRGENLQLLFEPLTEEDIPGITPVMKRAFDDDARRHLGLDSGGPPGYDNGDFFRTWLLPYPESVGYKVMLEGEIVGGIIVWILPGGDNILGTIFIDPDFQDQGLGQSTWEFIEQTYPDRKSWRLATPAWATQDHYFYQKCGFRKVDSDPLIPPEENSLIYFKTLA